MSNVWKIGTHWGNYGPSNLSVFLDNNCVFIGSCFDSRIGDWAGVTQGDYFIITEGSTPIALGKALGVFEQYKESDVRFTAMDEGEWIDDEVRVCPANIVLLPEEERRQEIWGNETRRRFCRHNTNPEAVAKRCEELLEQRAHGAFDIKPFKATLLGDNEHAIFQNTIRYRIPNYQRPYSWGEAELRRLLEELQQAVKGDEPCFLGTMQLSEPIPLSSDFSQKIYDIIDGQQRLTTFMLLLRLIEKKLKKSSLYPFEQYFRTLVAKGEEQRKLEETFAYFQKETLETIPEDVVVRNQYLHNLVILDALLGEYFQEEQVEDEELPYLRKLYEFLIGSKVVLVVIETHAGLSKTLQIFNTINTAGMDLGVEDLFKIRFYEYLKSNGEADRIFDSISALYARVEEYNRNPFQDNEFIWMENILITCQRVIVAREKLGVSVLRKAYRTFFSELFDTLLGLRVEPDFKKLVGRKDILSIEDVNRIIDLHIEGARAVHNNCRLRIMRDLIDKTRYGTYWDFPLIARFFSCIAEAELPAFTELLLKLLTPPSLYYARTVYAVPAEMNSLLEMLGKHTAGIMYLQGRLQEWRLDGKSVEQLLITSLEYEISGRPAWKNLLCRIIEVLEHQKVKPNDWNQEYFKKLFREWTEIEHIQCYTDATDRDAVWAEWGEELNRIGNLVILEGALNRSIGNRKDKKAENYAQSDFTTVRELKDKVASWTKAQAIQRREECQKQLVAWLTERQA